MTVTFGAVGVGETLKIDFISFKSPVAYLTLSLLLMHLCAHTNQQMLVPQFEDVEWKRRLEERD